MALCSAGFNIAAKGPKFSRSSVQIIPKIFRRARTPAAELRLRECQRGYIRPMITMADFAAASPRVLQELNYLKQFFDRACFFFDTALEHLNCFDTSRRKRFFLQQHAERKEKWRQLLPQPMADELDKFC